MAKITKSEANLNAARLALEELEATERAFNAEGWPLTIALKNQLGTARAALRSAELQHLYGHRAGTPETYAKINAVPPGNRQSPLSRMYENDELSDDQWRAVCEIEAIAELIESAVSVRGASLEARVDNAGAGRDVLIESLGRVRLEVTYTAWRQRLPMPKRLYLDMILTNQPLVATARKYGQPWRKARKQMLTALDLWEDIKAEKWAVVDDDDLNAVYARLGCGMIMPPKPKLAAREEDGE